MKLGILAIFTVLVQLALLFNAYALILVPIVLLVVSAGQILDKHNFTIVELCSANKVLMCFLALSCISILRTNHAGANFVDLAFRATSNLVFVYCFALICKSYIKRDKLDNVNLILYYVVLPFTMLALTNFVLYLGGISLTKSALGIDSGTYQALLLSYVGIDITRVEFPLAGGLNSYASYIGALFAITLGIWVFGRKKSFLFFISLLSFVVTLLMIDTRAALIYPLLITIYLFLIRSRKKISKNLRWLALVVALGPLLFTFLLPWLSTLPGFEFLERGDGDIQSGNARFFIWLVSLAEFADFKLIHLIGYGDYGHFGSGASKQWAPLFDNWADPQYKTPHNTMFSLVFDYGYIGLILYITIIWQSIEKISYLWSVQPAMAKVLFCFVLYNIVAGITEVLGGTYFPNYLLLFFMITIIINMQYYFLIKKRPIHPKNTNQVFTKI